MTILDNFERKAQKMVRLIDIMEEFPDEREVIWDYIGQLDFENQLFPVEQKSISLYVTPEFIHNYEDNAEQWQKSLVNKYKKNINTIKNDIFVVFQNKILDGNHRIMALYLAGEKTINVVDLD